MGTMKKRMLALVLTLTIIVGLGGQAWAEVLPGVESTSPEVSTQPENSASPEGTEAPQETTAPEETDAPEESAAPEETTVPEDSETPEEPVETPILDEAYALPGVENFAVTEAAPRAGSYTEVDGLDDVVGTTINVFDYWLESQKAEDDTNGVILPDGGINAGHVLLFGKGMSRVDYAANDVAEEKSGSATFNNSGYWNGWSGIGSGPVNGIVKETLGTDGFPQLALDTSDGLEDQWVAASSLNSRSRTESLAYLFDPDQPHDGKQSYTNVGGLLRVDGNGYYYYDSNTAFVSLRDGMEEEEYRNGADGVNFKLYTSNYYNDYGNKGSTTGGVGATGSSPNGQFFPFNQASQVFGSTTIASNDSAINHYFGMHMQSRFVQQYGGYTDVSKKDAVTYEFSGDDDVWIFIDDVLVADLGGIHDAVSVKIEFDTGKVTISSASKAKDAQGNPMVFESYWTTLKELFDKAGKNTAAFRDNTFADGTYHTLDFFYLERGNTDSNMNLKYNLVTVPESSIIKVDQTGNPVPGVTFELYTADRNYVKQAKIASGTTDENGQFVLVDNDGYIVSLQDIWTDLDGKNMTYPDSDGRQRGNLLLVESVKPEGYRSAGDVQLYLVNINGKVLLLSDNYWDTGAYAYTNSTIVMNGQLTYNNSQKADLDEGGTLFAVVLRRTSNVGHGEPGPSDNWGLMTGSATDGWHTGQPLKDDQSGVKQVLEELQKAENQENCFVAQPDSGESYAITVTNLPGEITSYYYLLGETEKRNTEYTVGFYYTTASSVQSATTENTWRVKNSDKWSRVFSANVHVPNIKNRLFVQKLAPDGTAVAEAEFTLYRDATCTDKVGTLTTMNLNKEQHGIQLDGAGVYPSGDAALAKDACYLKESAAPDGYTINPKVTKIIVDDTGVYADAGDADDGIVVARGVGSIVKSMAQFASLGDIDVTLNNIVARFYTVPSNYISGATQDFSGLSWREESNGAFVANQEAGVSYHPTYMYDAEEGTLELYNEETSEGKTSMGMHMQYSTQSGLEYDPGDSIKAVLDDEAVHWMTTDTGWSKLMMEQCLTHSQEMQTEGYHVTDLTSPTLYDLTNLFSGTVIVQVTDQHTTSLTINKQVQGVKDPEVAGQTYTFTVEKLETDGQSVDTDYTGAVTVRQDEKVTEEQFQSGVLTVSRQGTGEIVLLDVENGRYRVTETGHGSDKVGETQWQSAAYTTTSHNVTIASGTAVADISSYAADTATAAVQVTNLYAGAQPLTVTKTVGGTMGDTSLDFTFTLSLQGKQGTPFTGDITATKSGAGMTQPVTFPLTLTQSGNYTFTLKHGQRIFIQIPYDSKQVTVTEKAVAEYTTQSRSYASHEVVPAYIPNTAVQTVASMNGGYTVDFYNERNLGAPPSGVAPMSPGYTVMLWVGGASALVIFGCSFLVWRRRRRDWM